MSLAQALALVASKKNQTVSDVPATASKRPLAPSKTDYIEDVLEQIEQVAQVGFPNITIYGGDYDGNILGARVYPPSRPPRSSHSEFSSDSEDEAERPKSRVTALAKALARERGIDPSLLEQKHAQDRSIHLRPIVSGELHAGSIGSIATYGKFVVTAGSQDENIRLSKRNQDQNLNNLKEFGSLHRHDSSPTAVTFTPSNFGQLCLTGGENGIIYVWSTMNKWDCIGVFRTHTTRIVSIAAHPIVPMALSLSNDSKVVMWDLRPENFQSLFITQLRAVKPQWGTQPLVPMSLMFSSSGKYYSVMYNRCVYNYHTAGEHAGKIMSVIELPQNVTSLWSTMDYLDDDHILLGNEKGDFYIFNTISVAQLAHMTGVHKYRLKSLLPIPLQHTKWLEQYTQPLIQLPQQKSLLQKPSAAKTSKKSKTQPDQDASGGDSANIRRHFVSTTDSDGKMVLWQIEVHVIGSETVTIQPKSKQSDPTDNNLDDIDGEEKQEVNTTSKPKFSYQMMSPLSEVKGKSICTLNTNTRITCSCLGLPFDANASPLGNQYKSMGHVLDTTGESRTQYEDDTDRIYGKQQRDFAHNAKAQKDKDFKLKVRDYHRMKAGKIKDLSEGDAVKHGSNPSGSVIKGFGKEKYRKMDEDFQKEYEKKKADKEKGKTKVVGTAKNGRMGRLDKKANPSLAGTLRARRRNGGKGGKAPARGKKRF